MGYKNIRCVTGVSCTALLHIIKMNKPQKIGKNIKKRKEEFLMKYKKVLIPILVVSAVLLSACGKKKEIPQAKNTIPKAVLQPETEIEEGKEDAPAVIFYVVRLSGKTLSLYEVNGENEKLITSMEISPELYPKEDIEKLKKGIPAAFKEDGYEILENFAN